MSVVAQAEALRAGRFQKKLAITILGILLTAIYLLRLDGVVGLWKDDGWYVTIAKALAAGRGYRLINFADGAGVYYFPPGFPILLSFFYRLYPHVPENVWLLKAPSLLAMAVLGIVFYKLLHEEGRLVEPLAILVAACSVAAPCLVWMATSNVMSECVFAALQFSTLLAADRFIRRRAIFDWKGIVVISLLASLSFLLRSFGIALIAAIVIYFAKQRLHKQAIVFVVATAVFLTPWTLYKRQLELRYANPHAQSRLPGPYSQQFLERIGGSGVKMPLSDLPSRLWQNATTIVGADVGAVFLPSFYRSQNESGEEVFDTTQWTLGRDIQAAGRGSMGNARFTKAMSIVFSFLVMLGYLRVASQKFSMLELFLVLYLGLVIFWGGPPFRYLLPVVPLLFYYLTVGLKLAFAGGVRRRFRASALNAIACTRVVLLCLFGLFLFDHAGYVLAKRTSVSDPRHPDWLRHFEAYRQAARWIHDHTAETEVVTGDNIPMLYLFSDRETDVCPIHQCRKLGIRYYLQSDGGTEFPAEDIRFDSGYPYTRVAEFPLQAQSPPSESK